MITSLSLDAYQSRPSFSAHLDSDSIQALIAALKVFTGAVLLISHDRQAIKEIIEGKKSGDGEGDDDTQSSSSEEEEEEGGLKRPGRTYLLKDGQMRLLTKGVEGYVGMVERRLNK